MHIVGLLGSPRRTAYTTYGDNAESVSWMPYHVVMAISGMILFAALALMICIVIALMRAPRGYTEYPIAEAMEPEAATPRYLERWSVWIGITIILILFAYTIPVLQMIGPHVIGTKGYVTW
jgi:cytochrome c oxidase subunit 1